MAARAQNPPPAPVPPAASLEATRETLRKWVEAKQLTSKEQDEWRTGRELLQARLDLVSKELADLDARILEAKSKGDDGVKRKDELIKRNDELKRGAEQLAQTVAAMEASIREIVAIVPDGMQEKLKPLMSRMPEDPKTTKVSLAERFQNVVGVLNDLNRLSTEVVLLTEIRTLGDQKPQEFKTLYVGLAQAYFINMKGDVAGVGHPTAKGWEWRRADELAANIVLSIEILQNKHTPAMVSLPVQIQ